MYWGTVVPNGLIWLKEVGRKFKSQDYIDLLKTFAVPLWNLNMTSSYGVVQDNATIHKSKLVNEFMINQDFKFLDYPKKSPDLNPMENICKMISDQVYKEAQPNNLMELRCKINQSVTFFNFNKITMIAALFDDYRERLTKVLINCRNLIN